jgi:hypothetical protein
MIYDNSPTPSSFLDHGFFGGCFWIKTASAPPPPSHPDFNPTEKSGEEEAFPHDKTHHFDVNALFPSLRPSRQDGRMAFSDAYDEGKVPS